MAINVRGAGGILLDTTSDGEVKVVLSNTHENVGGVRIHSENDPGTVTGAVYLKSPETESDYRLRMALDSVWDTEFFNYTAQNTSKHKYTSNTLTMTWAGGFLNTNGGSVTTTATGCQIQTYTHFPVLGTGTLYVEVYLAFPSYAPTNMNLDFGIFLPAAASTSLPLDGCYYRYNAGGLFGVLNNNGTESTTSPFSFTPTLNQVYKFVIALNQNEVEFWIDDVLYADVERKTGNNNVFYSQTLPFAIRHHHTGVTSGVFQGKFSGYNITLGGSDTQRRWETAMGGQALSGVQGASGMTQGQTANSVNSTIPATGTLANITPSYTTLGGQFQFAAVGGAETDYPIFGYLNTVPTTSISGRKLVITNIWIDTFNMGAAVATTPTTLQWFVGIGSTGASLATVDAAATRAPRRIALGTQVLPIGTVIGGNCDRSIDRNFDSCLVVDPGTYLHIILKMPVATATASQIVRGVVGINAYWE